MSRLRAAALSVTCLVAGASAGFTAATQVETPAGVALKRSAPAASAVTAAVQRRSLSSAVTTRVSVRARQPRQLSLPSSAVKGGLPGRVTRPPVKGALLRENAVALELSGRPVVALLGSVPMYRDLGPGDEGDDVRQLEEALARLGLRPGPVDGRYDTATEGAVDEWLSRLGYEAQGPDREARESLRSARADAASAEESLLQARTALRTGTARATRSEILDAEREVRVAERALADAEAQAGLTASKVGVAQASAEGSRAGAEVALSRVEGARLDVTAAEASEETALRRVVLAEQSVGVARARHQLAQRAVAAAERREAAARRAVGTAERRKVSADRALPAGQRRVDAAARNVQVVAGRSAQLQRALRSAEDRQRLVQRGEATARADAARDNQSARQAVDAAKRSVQQASTDLRVAQARLQEVRDRDPAASDSEKQAAAAEVQRATDLLASNQEAVAAAGTTAESTRLRGADLVAQASYATDEAAGAAAAAAQAAREGREAVLQAEEQHLDAQDAQAELQEQYRDAEESVAAALDALAAAGDEIPVAQVAVQDADAGVATAQVGVSEAEAALAAAVAATSRSRTAVDEARVASLNDAASSLAALISVDEARAGAATSLSTVAGSKELLVVARARLEQMREPKDDTALKASEKAAARGVEDAQQRLDELEGDVGIRVPADELVFLPSLPLRVDEVRTTTGALAEGPLLQVTTGDVVGDGAVTLSEAELLRPGAKVRLTTGDGKQSEGTLLMVGSTPGTGGLDDQHVRIEVGLPAEQSAVAGTGLLARINVETTHGEVLVVPVTAVTTDGDGRARLEVARWRGTRRVWVTPGLSAEGLVEVTPEEGELDEGDEVVVVEPLPASGQ